MDSKCDPTKNLFTKALTLRATIGGYEIYYYNGVKLGEALTDVDGFYKFWFKPSGGSWNSYVLACIAEMLDYLNVQVEKDIAEYFRQERDEDMHE